MIRMRWRTQALIKTKIREPDPQNDRFTFYFPKLPFRRIIVFFNLGLFGSLEYLH